VKGFLLRGLKKRANLAFLYLPFVVLLVVPFLVGEEFPVSPFPMYNQWNEASYLIYFQDNAGEPVAIQVMTGYKAGRYRKMFDRQQRIIRDELATEGIKKRLSDFGPEEWKPCGIWLLEWLDRNCDEGRLRLLESLRPLAVIRRDLTLKNGVIDQVDTLVVTDEDREGWQLREKEEELR